MIRIAKHIVKCPYCGQNFDANAEIFIKIGRRYAHQICYETAEAQKSQDEKDKEILEKYIMNLFGIDYITPKIRKQINSYINEYHYSYSGILKALQYSFDVKGNDVAKANEGIGIVPYTYQSAYNYYYAIWLAKQKNKDKKIADYIPDRQVEVKIKSPKRKEKKKASKFNFLDLEEEEI